MKCTKCGYWSPLLCGCEGGIPVLKTFNDGTVLVSNGKEPVIMSAEEYVSTRLRFFDLRTAIVDRLTQAFPHLSILLVNRDSRDFVCIGTNEIYNLAIESYEFWMHGKTVEDVKHWLDAQLFPPIINKILESEHLRCCKSFDYFSRYYAKQRT